MNLQVKLTASIGYYDTGKVVLLAISFAFYKDEEVHEEVQIPEMALEQSMQKLTGFFGGDQLHCA
jgi:hypothetical protein